MPPCLQTNLTWLDLSFNAITRIEGLEKLVKLTDLSLTSNKIAAIENLAPLAALQVTATLRVIACVAAESTCREWRHGAGAGPP